VVKQCRSDDDSLGQKIVIKRQIQQLDLQDKLVILIFYLTNAKNKDLLEILGSTAETLIRLFVVVDISRKRISRN